MIPSYTVATPDTNDPAMLALRGPLAGSFAQLAALGYRGADLMVRDPRPLNAAEIARIAGDQGLRVIGVSTGQMAKEDGLTLSHADPAARASCVSRVQAAIDFAAAFAAPLNIGGVRGRLGQGPEREAARNRARESFAALAAHAARAGVLLCVEPQSRYFGDWLPTLESTLDWMGEFPGAPFALLADLYHMMLEEASPHAALVQHHGRIAALQISDTNRLAPGLGHWNFRETFALLAALRYNGPITVECLQTQDAPRVAAAALAPR